MSVSSAVFLGLGLALLFVVVNVALSLLRASRTPAYWRTRAAEPASEGALRVVAFGDSAMQAIGADRPEEGVAGRVAVYLEAQTGRPVHLANLAQGGATVAQVIEKQLPQADLSCADLVLVVTSNDLEKRVPLTSYRADLKQFLAALPTAKTVISDLPLLPGRTPYQQVLAEEADSLGLARADFAAVFSRARRLNIFSWLLPHLNSQGYALWFEAFRPPVESVAASL